MALITAASIGTAVAKRFPSLKDSSGVLNSVAAQEETVDLQAQALRSYTQPTGNFVWVKATEGHLVAGNHVSAGDIVQVTEADAATLKQLNRALVATDDEVAAAQKAGAGK